MSRDVMGVSRLCNKKPRCGGDFSHVCGEGETVQGLRKYARIRLRNSGSAAMNNKAHNVTMYDGMVIVNQPSPMALLATNHFFCVFCRRTLSRRNVCSRS